MTWSELSLYRSGETEYSVTYEDGNTCGIRGFGTDRRKAEQCLSDFALRGAKVMMTGAVPLVNGQGMVTDYMVQSAVTGEQYREMMKQTLQLSRSEAKAGSLVTFNPPPGGHRREMTPEEMSAMMLGCPLHPSDLRGSNPDEVGDVVVASPDLCFAGRWLFQPKEDATTVVVMNTEDQ